MNGRQAAGIRGTARYPRLFWAIVLFAFVAALGLAVACSPRDPARLVSDPASYHSLAVSILRDGSFQRSTFRAPGYPAFVAAIYAVAGEDDLLPVYFVQAILLAVTLVFVYRIAFLISESARLSLIAVAGCALWPPILLAMGDIMTEALSGALLAAAIWFVLVSVKRPSIGSCVAAGLLLGVASLTKGVTLPAVAVAALFVAFSGGERLRRLKRAVVLVCVAAAVVGPWVVRNYVVTGGFVPVQTGSGLNFWVGNWPSYWHQHYGWDYMPPEVVRQVKGKPEIVQERIWTRIGASYIREDPLRALGIFGYKFSALWLGSLGCDPRSSGNPIPHLGSFGFPKRSFFYAPLFALAVAGWFCLSADARKRAYPVMALLAIWTASYVAIQAVPRYAIPVVFYEILLAASAVHRVASAIFGWNRREAKGQASGQVA